jgi:hypothetical protein
VDATGFSQLDLADLEHNKNITEVYLRWGDDLSVKEALPMLKGCTQLRRITLKSGAKPPFPPSKELSDFIMEFKNLTFLHIIYFHTNNCAHFKSVVDEVKALILPRRPNFKFYVSCCSQFDESRISRTTKM